MNKKDLPSDRQARRIASVWAADRFINVMKEGRDGSAPYVDPTTAAMIKRGWLEPSGSMLFRENGYLWEPHSLTPKAMLALEHYLMERRLSA